ncbi:interleukin-like EMT inducer domain-containing protein [Flagellimonas sp. 2504JD4-2]
MKKLIALLFMLNLFQLNAQTSVYVKGTGYNYSTSRVVKLGSNFVVNSAGRGLCLTVINASTHQHVSSVVYDTYGNATASDNLASALNNLKRSQIGILTSYDAWENNVTTALQNAARRLGLYKLGGGLSSGSRRPYAAIFRGSGTSTANTVPNHIAYEVMQSRDSNAESAIIATWLIEDAFVGNNITNALVSGDGEDIGAPLIVNHLGYVGIGTYAPDSKLTVKGNIHTEEVKVDLSVPGPDYVFKEDYDLKSLKEVQDYIKEHGHLPNIPSAQEMEVNGIQLGEMNMKLLEKIEELTLYTLSQEKQLKAQQSEINRLTKQEERIQHLEKQLQQLLHKN